MEISPNNFISKKPKEVWIQVGRNKGSTTMSHCGDGLSNPRDVVEIFNSKYQIFL